MNLNNLVKATIFLSIVFLSGCGGCQRDWTHYTGGLTEKCHKGITYVQSDSGLALLVDVEGLPVTCGEK